MAQIRVGMAQLLVEPGHPDANLARAVGAVADAAAAGCGVVVLPECLDLGWMHASARTLAEPVPGPRVAALAGAAAEAGVHVAAGLVERGTGGEAGRVFNAAVLLGPDGSLLAHHRKISELEIALRLYTPGTSLAVTTTALGAVGLDVCADNLPASLSLGRALGQMGAQVVLSPSAWAVPPDHDEAADPYGGLWLGAYRALATEYRMPVVGVSNVGPVVGGDWDGWRCVGHSLAVGLDGQVLAQGPYDAEALVVVDVPLRGDEVPAPVRAARRG